MEHRLLLVADYSSESNQEAWSLDTGVKQGYVKEYVEKNGLGMIFSVECGLILFSDRHLYTGAVTRSNNLPPFALFLSRFTDVWHSPGQ